MGHNCLVIQNSIPHRLCFPTINVVFLGPLLGETKRGVEIMICNVNTVKKVFRDDRKKGTTSVTSIIFATLIGCVSQQLVMGSTQ